jgi:hypothetical protein
MVFGYKTAKKEFVNMWPARRILNMDCRELGEWVSLGDAPNEIFEYFQLVYADVDDIHGTAASFLLEPFDTRKLKIPICEHFIEWTSQFSQLWLTCMGLYNFVLGHRLHHIYDTSRRPLSFSGFNHLEDWKEAEI